MDLPAAGRPLNTTHMGLSYLVSLSIFMFRIGIRKLSSLAKDYKRVLPSKFLDSFKEKTGKSLNNSVEQYFGSDISAIHNRAILAYLKRVLHIKGIQEEILREDFEIVKGSMEWNVANNLPEYVNM